MDNSQLESAKTAPGHKGWPLVGCLPQRLKNPLAFYPDLARKYGPVANVKIGGWNVYGVSDPDGINYPIPGNDDAGRAITLYCDLVARAAIDGIGRGQGDQGVDIGAAENPIIDEPALEAAASGDFKGLSAPVGKVDDLKRINGIAPKLEQRLNDLGVFHFWQIAKLSKEDTASIEKSLSITGRIERDGWVAQARKLQDDAD